MNDLDLSQLPRNVMFQPALTLEELRERKALHDEIWASLPRNPWALAPEDYAFLHPDWVWVECDG